ncbi:hypothetical protein LPJ53_004461 [Coemansia erecta]|uniref:Nucleotide-diphospho-sugar transferase n=1 Tax=Coemansia erecta TaxID=147472 RepID=A0A9W7XZ03_9FUNG|nr:hypothetical protein LPJ53_004461 [Coemansia erecta]
MLQLPAQCFRCRRRSPLLLLLLAGLLGALGLTALRRHVRQPAEPGASRAAVRLSTSLPAPLPPPLAASARANDTCLLFVTRTMSLTKVRRTLFSAQQRFNGRFGHRLVVLGEQPFDAAFQQTLRLMLGSGGSHADVAFGQIDPADWAYPDWVDRGRARHAAADWAAAHDRDGDGADAEGRPGYRHMVRYWAAPFADHALLAGCAFVWRLEPGAHFTCDIADDPLARMRRDRVAYAFSVALDAEMPDAAPSLRPVARDFISAHPELFAASATGGSGGRGNSLAWLFADRRAGSSPFPREQCRFLTNSELVDLSFVRSAAYRKLFAFVDRLGVFYYERWSDATVRALAVALFLPASRVLWLDHVGYRHDRLSNCPEGDERQMRCTCDPRKSAHLLPMACSAGWGNSTGPAPEARFAMDPRLV